MYNKNNNIISSDDPNALEKLAEKLKNREERQEYMKEANSYYKQNGTMKGFKNLTDEQAKKHDTRIKEGHSWEDRPYSSFMLTNNSSEIRRLKRRIDELTTNKTLGFKGWKFVGGEAVANISNNRLQLFFSEKPSEEQRTELKAYGFKWSPKESAWQRQLNSSAIYACDRIDFVKPEDGKKPTELQPKAPKKNEPER